MLFHLTRYFVFEVLRVFLFTTAVLTTVIAFGAAIKPLAQDDLFSAGQIMRYVFAAMVPMLQYAMPVAAAFAVTLVIHRMSSDNEIVAAAASGISYTRLLRPIAGFALVLVVVMSIFAHSITPRFLRLLEQMISHDITLLFQTALRRDQAFQVGGLQIYADDLDVIDDPAGTDANMRMVLHRMAAVETGHEGKVKTDVTARQAVIDVFERNDQTYLKLLFIDLVGYKAGTGEVILTPDLSPDRALVVPTAFRDSLETRTTLQMYDILARPDSYSPVVRAKERLVEALLDFELSRVIRAALAQGGELRFQADGQNEFMVRASAFAGGELRGPPGGRVEVTQVRNGRSVYQFLCERVGVSRSQSALEAQPSLNLTLMQYEVIDLASGTRNVRENLPISELSLPGFSVSEKRDMPAQATLAEARSLLQQHPSDSGSLQRVAAEAQHLEGTFDWLHADVAGRTAQRIALSFAVLLFALAGMIMSMLMRGSSPLTIYTIVFVPSILCLMLIFGGTEVMRDGQLVTGGVIMWSGHAVLLAMCVEALRRLLRN